MNFLEELAADLNRINGSNGIRKWRGLISRKFIAVMFIRLTILRIPIISILSKMILLFVFNIELSNYIKIEKGLLLPHPSNIILGCVSLGHNVTIMHGVTLGSSKVDFEFDLQTRPKIQDNCFLGINCVILGGGTLPKDTIVPPNKFLKLSE